MNTRRFFTWVVAVPARIIATAAVIATMYPNVWRENLTLDFEGLEALWSYALLITWTAGPYIFADVAIRKYSGWKRWIFVGGVLISALIAFDAYAALDSFRLSYDPFEGMGFVVLPAYQYALMLVLSAPVAVAGAYEAFTRRETE